MGRIYEALEKEENRDPKQREPKQEEKKKSFLASPATLETRENLVVLGRPGSAIAEQFRFLRSMITQPRDRGKVDKTILISSSIQQEGKSYIASNLAATMCMGLDEHVLLVDADLRNPKVHTYFNIPQAQFGLSTHLRDGTPLPELLQKTSLRKLTVLPAGLSSENPAELISSRSMQKFVQEVRDRYPDRLVVFDSPPLKLAPEAYVLASLVDGFYLVVRRAKTPREAVKATLERLNRENFRGTILNGYEEPEKYYKGYKEKAYGHGYGYGYGYSYSNTNKHPTENPES